MDEDPDHLNEDEGEGEEGFEPAVTIEITGLSLFTHVGVTAAEREVGQRLLLDLRIDVGDCDATVTDRVEDTVDYAEVCDVVNLVAQQRSYKTLERLCAAIADRLIEQYDVQAVWVKAAKPEPVVVTEYCGNSGRMTRLSMSLLWIFSSASSRNGCHVHMPTNV